MSRRHDRQRRRDRKLRDRSLPDPGPPDMTRASEHWHAILATLTGRGFQGKPMFPAMILAPPVMIDLPGSDPPAAARAAVIEELIRRTVEQDEN
jgi:hypothetical protein